ncbi:Plasmodium exported protein (Pm-fam-a like), unknown function [Plasmodium malariae]|uniref:Fam-l protein n=1 Tax=Plasmodium malariae TaxID=5858 RepID=A0A1A8WT38_PLAMA|nr:Plasmodium exported protein (Pm-fam-a like), unknown function [Plasmodium malariae]
MEQKLKSGIFNKYLDEDYKHGNELYSRNYRLLAKYKQEEDLNVIGIKEYISKNGKNEKKKMFYNEKEATCEKNQLNYNFSKNEGHYKQAIKNKSNIFETKKYSYIEKKIFKELDFEDFLKKNRTISNKTYKKLIRKKCGLRLALPLIFFLSLSVLPILDYSMSDGQNRWLMDLLGLKELTSLKSIISVLYPYLKWAKGAADTVSESNHGTFVLMKLFDFLLYIVPFFMLGVIFILIVVYYHKKIKKYEKIKYRNGK